MIELIGFLTILITPNAMGWLAYLKKTQLIECFANHQISVKRSNDLLELHHNNIKFLF